MRINERSRVLVELPMLLLLRIADAAGGMTAREMERFDELLAKREWCHSRLLRHALQHTAEAKASLWREYAAGEFRVTIERAAADLDTVLAGAPAEEREPLQRDLSCFCEEIQKASRLGLFRANPAAKREAATLIELASRPSAPASVAAAAAPPTPTAPRALLGVPEDISGAAVWREGKVLLHCLHIVQETHDVRTFQFTADPAKLFAFRPGQFLTFEFPIDGKTLRRSYSIASSPSRPYTIEVTIKRVDGGRISNWMHDNMTPGASLYATGPFGKFVCPSERDIPLLFLSGGSGATPVMSMTRWLADTAPGADVVFLHFARSPSDVLFHSELAALERRMPRLRNLFVCSRVEPSENWRGPTGRVSADLLRELAPDFAGRRVMLCGPIGFMQSAETALRALQFDMSRFEQESFGGPPRPVTITPSTASVASTAEPTVIMPAPMVKVRFAASMIEAKAARADYLLDVALEKGVDIPYSCRAGQCGSCKATLIEGKVEQNCVDGLKADDVANGMILLCQTRPRGDVTLDL